MQETGITGDGSDSDEKIGTVAGAVLTTFFDELAKSDDLADIAANLRKIVLDDGVFFSANAARHTSETSNDA